MDPVLKIWLYEQWLGDHRDDAELAKNHAYLLGSFWNPEAVQQMMNPNVHESTDEDFKKSLQMVRQSSIAMERQEKSTKKRRKKRKATLPKE